MKKYRFLIARRVIQIALLALFALGNYSLVTINNHTSGVYAGDISKFSKDGTKIAGAKKEAQPAVTQVLQGNLTTSKFLGVIPMSEPFVVAQMILAGATITADIWLGALVVLLFYGIFAGRAYCAYVCPMNMVTDFASWLRTKLGFNALKVTFRLSRNVKYGVLALSLLLSALLGVAAFEMINPMAMLHRGIAFGMGVGLFGALAVFLFDFLLLKDGFCGHICPLGASYQLIGKGSLLRVKHNADKCTKCMKCVAICPESQVLEIIGKQSGTINGAACSKCGRCVEVCGDDALSFGLINLAKTKKESK